MTDLMKTNYWKYLIRAPHLIKPPWKKKKDRTYRIRMTCGSILWLKISPQSRWITCGKLISEISKSTEQLVRVGYRRKASSLSAIRARLWGNFSPSHQVHGAAHIHAVGSLSASGGWTAAASRSLSVCARACFWKGSVDSRVSVCLVWQSVFVSSCISSLSLQKVKTRWKFKGTAAFVLIAASCIIRLN